MNPFDFVNDINYKKKDLLNDLQITVVSFLLVIILIELSILFILDVR